MITLKDNIDRAVGFISTDRDELSSIQSRQFLYRKAYSDFLEAPFLGKGALALYYETKGSIYEQPYAHNLFLEMLGEQGIIGFLLVVFILLKTCYSFVKVEKDSMMFCLFLCFTTYLIGAQFSGNILDSKMIFVFSILIINYSVVLGKKTKVAC